MGFSCFMTDNIQSIEKPVILPNGKEVYTYEYIEKLREENKGLWARGEKSYNIVPSKGFQEKVLMCDADFMIIGGNRGGGKTFIALDAALPYVGNPMFRCYGFRKLEDDIERGLWESSRLIYSDIAKPNKSYFEWVFPSGATMKFEHLQNPKTIVGRFRGAEQPFMLMEEIQEHTVDSMDIPFTLIGSNRNTIGVKNKFIGTCNPVGKSNQLRHFLDWYIDPETDRVIPERSGVVRYYFRMGKKTKEIAWGMTREEVYEIAKHKIDPLAATTGEEPLSLISSFCFIEGKYSENVALRTKDKTYMRKLAQQDEKTIKDIEGIWRDTDNTSSLITVGDMESFFNNTYRKDGFMRASADVALTGDFFVLYAFDGHHVCDVEAWTDILTDDVVPFIRKFLEKNGVRYENFTFDSNGLGLWLKDYFPGSKKFNNKEAPSDPKLWNNLKSECAERFVQALQKSEYSIDEKVLDREIKGISVRERLMSERLAMKRKETDNGRFEIISKQQMKIEVGHSPDFMEALFMIEQLMNGKTVKRSGLWRL